MFPLLIVLSLLTRLTLVVPHCVKRLKDSEHAQDEVFTSKEAANVFMHRRLLYNRFDIELFTPGDLERECYEEFCNYEEAREIFGDDKKAITFWRDYSTKGPTTRSVLQLSTQEGPDTRPPSFSEALRRLSCLHCHLQRMQDYLPMNRQ